VIALLAAAVFTTRGIAQTETFTGTVDSAETAQRAHPLSITTPTRINATLNWTDATADLNLQLQNPSGVTVAFRSSTSARPERLSYDAKKTGTWQLVVIGQAGASSYTLDVTMRPLNRAPIATDDSAFTRTGRPIPISVLENDRDPDGDALSVASVTSPSKGTATPGDDGTILYTPKAGFVGLDSFNYQACDAGTPELCDGAAVRIEVGNHAPVVKDDRATTTADASIQIDVLANDSDPDGDPLSVASVSSPGTGTSLVSDNGTIVYTPTSAFTGSDSFTYEACDDAKASMCEEATVTISPNVVIVLTDDQSLAEMGPLSTVKSELAGHGVNFTNGFVVNPWCCPSRTSLLTGKYSHSTGVYTNTYPFGGAWAFRPPRDASTLATWLDEGGYNTALIGKYLNGYKTTYVPPGWDRWVAFCCDPALAGGRYFDYTLNVDGVLRTYGGDPADYSTDVLGAEAETFIRNAPDHQPLFLFFTPFAPHSAAIPAPRHATAFSTLPIKKTPSFNEFDVADKPAYIRSRALVDNPVAQRRLRLATLLSVDEAVASLMDALSDEGRLENTFIVFASDNGILHGEHRWRGKVVPYEESIHVPLIVRFDPLVEEAREDAHFALNVDLAPTIAELARVPSPGVEGRSLLPLLGGSNTSWRSDFLIEHLSDEDTVPSYCAVRNQRHLYVVYVTGEEELYDLLLDPYQMTNVATDPLMETTLQQLRIRAKELCSPPPPGFTFPY
jgi:arylsulfatase A-like enzyme